MTRPPCLVADCGKPKYCNGYCRAHYARNRRNGDPLGGRASRGEGLRFVNDVALHHASDGCLTWPFGKNSKGCGLITIDGKTVPASRYVCERVHGAPPTPEHEAAHSCGKGHEACVAPGHLSWKTPKQNQADKLLHGTHNRGERHPGALLTEKEVRTIRSLKGEVPMSILADRYHVSRRAIENILAGRSWCWMSEAADKEKGR